jgi:glycosyltransferase involved in cell wall biosynthesis
MDCAVIIPLFNGEPWIRETMDAVFAQTLPPAEVVVVDDGSTDRSPELAQAYSDVVLLRNPNKGALSARNWGFEHISSPLVAFLDQDDFWHPDHLKRLHDALVERAEAPAAVSLIKLFKDPSVPYLGAGAGELDSLDPWAFYPLGSPIVTPSAVVIRRSAQVDSGGWYEAFTGVGDYHRWLRLTVRRPLVLVRAETTARRIHKDSQFRKMLASDPIGRLERRARAAEDAGKYRLEAVAEEHERLVVQRRMGLARVVVDLAKAVLEGETFALEEVSRYIEEALEGESEDRVMGLFQFLSYSLCSSSEPGRSFDHIFNNLFQKHWSKDAARSRAGLQKYMTLRAVALRRQVQAR